MSEQTAGLEHRYNVERANDPDGKHDDCRYFVLDPQHDPIARTALRFYAAAALRAGYEPLFKDLWEWVGDDSTAILDRAKKEVDQQWIERNGGPIGSRPRDDRARRPRHPFAQWFNRRATR